MWFENLFKKSRYTDFSAVGVDMHSHMVPGVDDGAVDLTESIAMINGLKALGFYHLITTPHTYENVHENTDLSLTEAFTVFEIHQELPISLSSEYFLDEHFKALTKQKKLLPFGKNRILVEFNQHTWPRYLEEDLFDLIVEGYQIVLAHPERYLFFHDKFKYYERLKDIGIEFQINALSLTGYYSKRIKSVAEKLIDLEMIDFIGTDIHHASQLPYYQEVPKTRYFEILIDSGKLKNRSLFEQPATI